MTEHKMYAIIPSRYASTRFPAKALAEIDGKPLFWYAYTNAVNSGLFSDVYLATDDERIFSKATELGVQVVNTSAHHPSGTDRVREAAEILGLEEDVVIANIQGDEPFIKKEMFAALLQPFEKPLCQVSTLGVVLKEESRISSPNQVKIVLGNKGQALYFSRSPIPYNRDALENVDYFGHIGVYAFRHEVLKKMASLAVGRLENIEKLEQLRLLENNIPIHVSIIEEQPHGVDTPEDLEFAQKYYEEHFKKCF